MNLDSKIQEINDYYDFRRAKRDHRNPSTGAFQAYERSGVVKLNYCIETGDRDSCVHIPDKTGYLKISQEVDDNNGDLPVGFTDYVTVSANIDVDTHSNSQLFITDENENEIAIAFDSESDGILVFKQGTTVFGYSLAEGKVVGMNNNIYAFPDPVLSRNVNGDLLAFGLDGGTNTTNTFKMIDNFFPIWV